MNLPHKYRNGLALSLATGMLIVVLMLGWPVAAYSASNIAIDPGGGGVLLNPSGTFTVNSVQLALIKQARDLSGAVLANGANVTSGQTIYFVLFVDNTTSVTAIDIRMTDNLNQAQFTYIPNGFETTAVPSGSSDAAIWAGTWTPQTDAVGAPDDLASAQDTAPPVGVDRITIGAVTGQANQRLDIPGNNLRAFRFRVTVN